MKSRRDFLKTTAWGTGAAILSSRLPNAFADADQGKPPMRFIFMHKGNGLFPSVMVPPSLSKEEMAKEARKEAFEVDLAKHDLPPWMSVLNDHKQHMTILQGLSGKMCTNGHHSWQSCLGVYAANERLSSIKWATVDFELAKLFPSPLEHIELACFPIDGGNARGNIHGIEKGFSARGPQQPNYAFGSPKVAINELFKSVSSDKADRIRYELERKVLEFTSSKQSSLSRHLAGLELAKVKNYAEAMEDIRQRNNKLESMGDVIGKNVPKLDSKYFADDLSTIDCQIGHTLHDVGHGKGAGKLKAEEVRENIRTCHMSLIDTIVRKLKSVPEGNGTMFDNTMLFYFPDNGETHHGTGIEWPYLVLSGRNARLNIAGRYVRLPYWGHDGHKTIGNWFTTILNAYGNPIKHYGDLDLGLNKFKMDQTGPIRQFMA